MNSLTPLKEIALTQQAEQYRPMLSVIEENRDSVALALSHHGKTHTQFQYAMLDNAGPVAGPTKLRNMRQVLAVIDRTEAALQESYFSLEEKRLDLEEAIDSRPANARTELKIRKLKSEISRAESATAGAVRKLAAYYEQYKHLEAQIKDELGVDEITESDFERDEERFHVMKVFEQALCAARAQGGRIDHGNMIYFHDIGINGGCAQADVLGYLQRESEVAPKCVNVHEMHRMECDFLDEMAKKYAGCGKRYSQRKGLLAGPSQIATLGCGRTEVGADNDETSVENDQPTGRVDPDSFKVV